MVRTEMGIAGLPCRALPKWHGAFSTFSRLPPTSSRPADADPYMGLQEHRGGRVAAASITTRQRVTRSRGRERTKPPGLAAEFRRATRRGAAGQRGAQESNSAGLG